MNEQAWTDRRPITERLRAAARAARGDEGVVMIAAMLILVSLAVMGTAAIMTSTVETKIAGNELRMKQAFYSSDAATQESMEWLSKRPSPPHTISATTTVVKLEGDGEPSNDYGGIDYDGSVGYSRFLFDVDYSTNRMVAGSSTNYREFFFDVASVGVAEGGARSEVGAEIAKIYRVDY